jgi:sec-independent protein translocase protein TatA
MFGLGISELLIIALILVMLFGVKRLPDIGNSFGRAISNFRKAADGKEVAEIEAKKEG